MRWAVVVTLAFACGRIDFDSLDGSPVCGGWSTPQPIPELASSVNDWAPALSPDGQLVVFQSERLGINDLFLSMRQGNAWTPPTGIATLNGVSTSETSPSWNAAGTRLYFSSNRTSSYRIYQSEYDGSFGSPVIAPGLADIEGEAPVVWNDELEMLYNGIQPVRVMRASRSSTQSPWTAVGEVTELNDPGTNGWVTLSSDGLELMLETTRNGVAQIYTAQRPTIVAPFEQMMLVPELDLIGQEGDPELSRDGTTLWFCNDATGSNDLYVTTRTCN